MLMLSRTVRFCLSQGGALVCEASDDNTFAAWPPMRGLGSYYELTVNCEGEADAATGYFINIREMDEAVRAEALPLISQAAQRSTPAELGLLLQGIIQSVSPRLMHSVCAVELRLCPTFAITLEVADMKQVILSQEYEFSAAHRLHCDTLSASENIRIFGKCNNPAGHGHNYKVMVCVKSPIRVDGSVANIEQLDAVVHEAVILKLDHKHLNIDVPQFARLNPSVENISKVVYEMLEPAVEQTEFILDEISVWETGKTVCTYRK